MYEVIKEVENVRFLKVDIADHPFDHKQLKTNYTFVRTWWSLNTSLVCTLLYSICANKYKTVYFDKIHQSFYSKQTNYFHSI